MNELKLFRRWAAVAVGITAAVVALARCGEDNAPNVTQTNCTVGDPSCAPAENPTPQSTPGAGPATLSKAAPFECKVNADCGSGNICLSGTCAAGQISSNTPPVSFCRTTFDCLDNQICVHDGTTRLGSCKPNGGNTQSADGFPTVEGNGASASNAIGLGLACDAARTCLNGLACVDGTCQPPLPQGTGGANAPTGPARSLTVIGNHVFVSVGTSAPTLAIDPNALHLLPIVPEAMVANPNVAPSTTGGTPGSPTVGPPPSGTGPMLQVCSSDADCPQKFSCINNYCRQVRQ